MSNAIRIDKEEAARRGRYVARVDGVEGEAVLTYTIRGPQRMSADHTEAPETMRGTGAALALVEHMIADARASGIKVVPLCPYVQAQAKKHPEWADVLVSA